MPRKKAEREAGSGQLTFASSVMSGDGAPAAAEPAAAEPVKDGGDAKNARIIEVHGEPIDENEMYRALAASAIGGGGSNSSDAVGSDAVGLDAVGSDAPAVTLSTVNYPVADVARARMPEQVIKTQDEVSENLINEGFKSMGVVTIKYAPTRRGQQLSTSVTLNFDALEEGNDISIQAKRGITPFEREVHDAILSLAEAGNNIFSPPMVYRAMTGKTNSEYIGDEKVEKVIKSIDVLMTSKMKIVTQGGSPDAPWDKATMEGMLIAAQKLTIEINGQRTTGYKLLSEPLLYSYAKRRQQIATIPINLLDTPLNKTDEVVVLQGHLLRQIELSKRSRKSTLTVMYDELFKNVLNQPAPDRKWRMKTRKSIHRILDYWIQKGYVGQYYETTHKNATVSITIDLSAG